MWSCIGVMKMLTKTNNRKMYLCLGFKKRVAAFMNMFAHV